MSDNTHYKKRNINAKRIETINKHLSHQCKAEHDKAEEMPIKSDTVDLHANESYQPRIREMLRR